MADKGLNLFDECAADEYIRHIKRKSASLLPEVTGTVYTPGTIANSQRTPTEINKNDANAKVRI